ncbi:NTP transferase domain-containing protein [Candidatus Pacearchaeota archaeon]|nr:NTP transferase domain-containing protein [Candidatus Pacearchaeota archaeon]
MISSNIALVYLVAGLSSRFGNRIKHFAEVGENGETMIEFSLQQALKAGFSKIVFVVGRSTESLFKIKFGDAYKSVPIFYAFQEYDESNRDKPWGTVDALCVASKVLDCPFIVCTGDDLYGEKNFKKMVQHLKASDEEASISYALKDTVPDKGTVNRALFERKGEYVQKITDVFSVTRKEIRSGTDQESCMTLFALNPEILPHLRREITEFKIKNEGDRRIELPLHKTISKLIEEGKIRMKLYPSEEQWVGITNPGDEAVVRDFIASRY